MFYQEVYAEAQRDPEGFWMGAAEAIDWDRAPSKALFADNAPLYEWFADGMVSVRTRSDGALVLPDHRYGLYTQHTTSIFRARLPAGAAA